MPRDHAPEISPTRRAEPPPRPPRDERLDFFRGLLQLFIFIGHIPWSPFDWLIHRSWGFSDSSELFVLFSGYVLGSVGARAVAKDGWVGGTGDLGRRSLRLWRRHLVVFLLFVAMMTGFARLTGDSYWDVGIGAQYLLDQPWPAAALAAILAYQPVFLDILPLFVLMMLSLPLLLAIPRRFGLLAVAPAAALWLLVQATGVNPPTWPAGAGWTFNPIAWCALFWLGAALGRGSLFGAPLLPAAGTPAARALLAIALAVVALGIVVKPTWLSDWFWFGSGPLLAETLGPLDKPNLGWLSFAHALAVAYVGAALTRADSPWYRRALPAAVARCGRYSLEVFCLGLFLAMTAHFVTRHIHDAVWTFALVNLIGIAILLAYAWRKDRARAKR